MTLNISFLGFWYLPQYVMYAKILTWHKITCNKCMVIVKPYLHYTSQFMQNMEFFPSWVRPCVHSIIKVKVKKRVIYCFGTCIGIQHLSLARISLALVIFFSEWSGVLCHGYVFKGKYENFSFDYIQRDFVCSEPLHKASQVIIYLFYLCP